MFEPSYWLESLPQWQKLKMQIVAVYSMFLQQALIRLFFADKFFDLFKVLLNRLNIGFLCLLGVGYSFLDQLFCFIMPSITMGEE